jgi:glucosamine--fructose-6-phosphate aminotransferase (isomerizing)
VSIIACGTSYYAGMVGKYLIESLAEIPVDVDVASEFRYRKPVLLKDTLVITVSQSGETADTLAAIRLAKEHGLKTLSICNVRNSTIDREAHGHLYMNSGPEIGVASTKAFVSTLAVFNLVAVAFGQARGLMSDALIQEHVQALLAVPSQMEVVLAYDKYFADAAESLKDFKGFLYMGRGVSFPIALEGALKLKELAYLHAEGYAAGEMKHGPLALIDERMAIVMVAPSDDLFEKTVSNLEEAKARGGKIISIGTGENARLKSISDRYLGMPKAHWSTNPLLAVVPLQLMAFHLADSLGHDVDQPRNLAKSVTVE